MGMAYPLLAGILMRDRDQDPSATEGRAPGSPAAENVRAIHDLEHAALSQRTVGERVADTITAAAGSTWFVGLHLVWFLAWLLVNRSSPRAFDPYPFPFLTFVVSLEAIFLSLIVLVSQNRLTRQAERRAHIDLQINLLAEQESTRTLAIVQDIARRLGEDVPTAPVDRALAARTDLQSLAAEVDSTLQSVEPPRRAPGESASAADPRT